MIQAEGQLFFTYKGSIRYISMACKCNVRTISMKGVVYVDETLELNRLEYMILESLYVGGCKDRFHGMTIAEILDDNDGALGKRMTVWKKMKKMVDAGYIAKGILDNHADTYYLLEKSVKIIESLKEEEKYGFEG